MDPHTYLIQGLLLPELKLENVRALSPSSRLIVAIKQRKGAVCVKCANFSCTLYDKRRVVLRDAPIHGKQIILEVFKQRYYCKQCKRAFTESLPGVMPKKRTTQRYRTGVYWAAENFTDLKRVCKAYRCSPGFVYKAYYEKLDLKSRMHNRYPFTSHIGIDEHAFGRKKGLGKSQFVTMVVDHNNKKLREVALGKTHAELTSQLQNIPGRENVKLITLDMSDSYKSFAKSFFPNAKIVADRFHVQRLIQPVIHEARMALIGDKRRNPVRVLMNKNRSKLKYYERGALDQWLSVNPEMKEIYLFKEAITRLYRIRGFNKAENAFNKLTDELAKSKIKPLHKLRKTFMRWREEILNYFKYRITNARVEGFNNVAKVIKRRAYGFRSYKNYRLRLLNACS